MFKTTLIAIVFCIVSSNSYAQETSATSTDTANLNALKKVDWAAEGYTALIYSDLSHDKMLLVENSVNGIANPLVCELHGVGKSALECNPAYRSDRVVLNLSPNNQVMSGPEMFTSESGYAVHAGNIIPKMKYESMTQRHLSNFVEKNRIAIVSNCLATVGSQKECGYLKTYFSDVLKTMDK